jgi:tetratricopeptide (TPR) repeat protein
VLVAPTGNFAAELARINLAGARVRAIPPEPAGKHLTQTEYFVQSEAAELADLRRALKQGNVPEAEASRICREHQRQRRHLAELTEMAWIPNGSVPHVDREQVPSTPVSLEVVNGLPPEFADYFQGFIAWQHPALTDRQAARVDWERVLARPESERRYKSTWAAFMLGKSWEKDDPEKAISYFKQVRQLARQGFHDTLGLAAASLGLEARVYLQQTNYGAAIEMYLEQMASGDPTATNSLAFAAEMALGNGLDSVRPLAKNPRTRKVITACVISRRLNEFVFTADQAGAPQSPTGNWLLAVEEAGIKDMDSAEALALAAYRVNDMDTAGRWINRAPSSPLCQWLQAKILLRAGNLPKAAAFLARIAPLFPIIHEGTNGPVPLDRKDTLTVGTNPRFRMSAERQVHGELGVLRLARGEYAQALDSLLNAGFWMDAAYVAERVLTLEELQAYVDRFWPPATPDQTAEQQQSIGEVCPTRLREQIRYLLARRLTRELHGERARPYYPTAWVGAFDQLAATLRVGWNQASPAAERAQALFQAALITRTNGMELIGTEVAPDWHYHLGAYEEGVTGEARGSDRFAEVVRPSNDELRRNAEHHADPELRFHYRYQAASLAWEAARLLPDNTDRTAFILWQGGSFLRNRDPQFADLFYKALVSRNRKTLLGAEADRQRWFPTLDRDGKIETGKREPDSE